jgi:proline dehydrogenase
MGEEAALSFDNTENAFAYKTNQALKKADFLFSSMGHAWLVRLGTRVTPWMIRTGLPVKGMIRNTIFSQFVGGETLEETAVVARKLGEYGVQVILDYGVEGGDEGEEGFDKASREFVRVIGYAATQRNIPFISVKVTGLCRYGLLEKLDRSVEDSGGDHSGSLMTRFARALGTLSPDEVAEWARVEERMMNICRAAAGGKIGVLIDAEETWIQDPVDVLTIMMMERFNSDGATVYNTIQLYRKDRLVFLRDSFEAAVKREFILGVKLVRGAYMEKERRRAEEMGYPSPVQPDKESTDRDYNEGLEFSILHADRIALIVASHNEQSNLYAVQLLRERGLALNHPHIHFSQLYGMSDNITFNLAKAGCAVSKYLPYGPIRDVIPYLMRRAQENSSVSGQTGRELGLIRKEMKRRGM